MTKKSKRHPLYNEKDQSSCMSGFISLFDFRQHRITQKLLSDRKSRTRHTAGGGYLKSRHNLLTGVDKTCSSTDDGDRKIQKIGLASTSVKKLIEEEMSNEQQHHPKHKNGDATTQETQFVSSSRNNFGKNHKQSTKSCHGANDMHIHDSIASASLEYQPPCDPNTEEPSSNKVNLASVMEEFCNQFHHTQEAHSHHKNGGNLCNAQERNNLEKHNSLDKLIMQLVQSPNISEKLSVATEAFHQKFIEAEQQNRGHQSKPLMDALELLKSNKELFLKLLQDPDSLLVKAIQDLCDAEAVAGRGKPLPEESSNPKDCKKAVCDTKLHKQNVHNFFRRKNKSQNINPSKGGDDSQALNRIILLKPGPESKQNSGTETSPSLRNEERSMRVTSHFSFTDIRRKLKHVMGERRAEHHWPPMERGLHRMFRKHAEPGGSEGINEEVTERSSPREIKTPIEKTSSPMDVKGRGKVRQSKYHLPDQSKDCKSMTRNENAPASVDGRNTDMKDVEESKERETNIYIEAIKHLADMVSIGKDVDLSSEQIPKTLGRILSLPEYSVSPSFRPGRDKEHAFSTSQMNIQVHDNVQITSENVWPLKEDDSPGNLMPLRQNTEAPLSGNDDAADRTMQVLNSNSDDLWSLPCDRKIQESTSSVNEDLSPKVDVNTDEVTNCKFLEENIPLEMLSEPICITGIDTTNQSTDTINVFEEEETDECLKLDLHQQNQSSSSASGPSSPSSVLTHKIEDKEGIYDKLEQPSPVSVLDPFIGEDSISPGSTISRPVEPQIQPLKIHFGEQESSTVLSASSDPETYVNCGEDKRSTFNYVKSVLKISGLGNWDEFLEIMQYSDELLDPPLFDEVEALSGQLRSDQKLLFDCINEVLVDMYEHYFGCSPWISFAKPNIRPIPVGKNLFRELWEGIDFHLLPQNQPLTLDRVLQKDMAKDEKWMDLRSDIDAVGNKMRDIILEELTEEVIYELCM